MMMESFNVFKAFISMKRNDLVFYIISLSLFNFIMILYNVELGIIIYASVIWLFVASIYVAFSFYKYSVQLSKLQSCNQHKVFIANELPMAKDQVEEEYHKLITKMNTDNQELRTSFDQKQSDIDDYYTLWTHQIKTPIAASKLLVSEDIDAKSISQLKQELLKIEGYVESALYFARLDSMSQDFEFGQVDLDVMIKSVIRKYSTFFIYNKISLVYEPINVQVITDQKWLMFVLEQLLSNALKYTKEGSITISYSDMTNSIEIQDTGIGIKEEDISQVFNKGFTGFNGRMVKSSTGIGLYLCDQIIRKLGHKINIDSKLDIGTRVSVCLNNNINLTKV